MKNVILTIGVLLCTITALAQKTYFCSPNGSATAEGTIASPVDFATGIEKMSRADTLYCRGGQYNLKNTIHIKNKDGFKDNRTVIMAYKDEKPIFDFRKQEYGKRGIMVESDNMYIKGITIRYTGKNGLFNIGSYSVFENLDVYGNGDTGIQMKNGHSNLILNCDSHDNFDYKLKGIDAADFGGNADGFADKQYYGGGNTYRGCRAWNNSDDGWDFYAHSTAYYGGTVIEDCICFGNGPEEYDVRKHPRYETDKEWFDQFKGDGIDITDNDGQPGHVSLRHYTNYGNGNGFKLGGKRTVHNVTVKNCISVKNRVKGFDQNNNLGSMCLYNNTSYQNGENYGFHNKEEGGKLAIRNSISIDGQRNDVLKTATTVHTNNTWDTEGIQATVEDFKSVDYQKYILAKRQADGSLPQTPLFRLTQNSKLRNAGTYVGTPYSGDRPDIGTFESGKPTQKDTVIYSESFTEAISL